MGLRKWISGDPHSLEVRGRCQTSKLGGIRKLVLTKVESLQSESSFNSGDRR